MKSLYHVVSFAEAAEAAAFVAALSRFLNYPQGSAYLAHPASVMVWGYSTMMGKAVDLYLSADALQAATSAFGSVPVAETRQTLPLGCKLILGNHETPSWGMSDALRHHGAVRKRHDQF